MNRSVIRSLVSVYSAVLMLLPVTGLAQQYRYSVEGYLPVRNCTSVDVSPDGTLLVARNDFFEWNSGYSLFDARSLQHVRDLCHFSDVTWTGRFGPDGRTLWVTRYYGGILSQHGVDDCSTRFERSVGSWTFETLFDDERRYLFVAENDPGTGAIGSVKVFDTIAYHEVASIGLNGEPGCFAKARGDRFLYVMSRNPGTERLYKIDASTLVPVATLDLPGIGRMGISVSPDGSRVYVPNRARGVVHVINPSTMRVDADWPVPGDPSTRWGFYVVPHGSHGLLFAGRGRMAVISLATGEVVDEVPISERRYFECRPAWSSDGRTGFIPLSEGASGSVAVVRVHSGEIISLVADGTCPGGGPIRIEWSGATPNGQAALIFARCQGDYLVPARLPCQGTQLGLCANQIQVAWTGVSDRSGSKVLNPNAGGGACGSFLQLLDLTTCETSNAARIE